MPSPLYRLGFSTLEQETRLNQLPIQGHIPPWLTGTLVRNGPAKFEVGAQHYNHWFDGLAMLHTFSFQGGRVSYANRFLESQSFMEAREHGKISRGEFGTNPGRSLLGRVMALFSPRTTDNAAVSINMVANEYIALTETPVPLIFDPATLRTLGAFHYDDPLKGQLSTAHPHFDFVRNQYFNYCTQLSRKSTYHLFSIAAQSRRRQLVSSIAVDTPAYMHSFGMTQRYVILAEFPLVVRPLALRLSGKPFIENFQWQPQRGTRFRVISKDDGHVVATCESEAFFAFHHVNAFEQGDDIVVDLIAYPDATIIDALYLDKLRRGRADLATGQLRRYCLRLTGGDSAYETLSEETLEFPRIHYKACNANPYRYLFATGNRLPHNFHDQLVKIDVQDRTSQSWFEQGCYPGEPVFVAAPDTVGEDEGVILSVVLDAQQGSSFLLILEARSFAELARARVPHHIPFGLHGQYFGDPTLSDQRQHLHR
jgi:carotenoid cleavage dioxygenase-like enzyme